MSDDISTPKVIALIKALGAGGGGGGDAHGIPSGGTTGQILKKSSSTDYAVEWATNSINNLSGTSISYPDDRNILAYEGGSWRNTKLRQNIGSFYDDGEGHIVFASYGNEPSDGFSGYAEDMESLNTDQYDLLWRSEEFDELGTLVKETWFFICTAISTPYNLKIRRFVGEYDENTGGLSPYYEQPAASTHEVSHTWVGTAAEYAALAPNYDANTLYYIKEA